jgi:hypothetical protein
LCVSPAEQQEEQLAKRIATHDHGPYIKPLRHLQLFETFLQILVPSHGNALDTLFVLAVDNDNALLHEYQNIL